MVDASTKTSYITSGLLAVFGALSVTQWATVIGTLIALATFFINWYYRNKSRKDAQEHYRRMEKIHEKGPAPSDEKTEEDR